MIYCCRLLQVNVYNYQTLFTTQVSCQLISTSQRSLAKYASSAARMQQRTASRIVETFHDKRHDRPQPLPPPLRDNPRPVMEAALDPRLFRTTGSAARDVKPPPPLPTTSPPLPPLLWWPSAVFVDDKVFRSLHGKYTNILFI